MDPSQEHAYEDDQMLRDKVGELAAEWANEAEVRLLLQQLLDRPLDDVLGVASIFPFGGLLDRHIVQLDALANDLKSYFVVNSTNYSYAMHVWLFHLLGGRQASLTAPTADTRANFTRAIGKMCTKHADSHRSKLATLQKEVTRHSRTGGQALTRAELAYIGHASSRATVLVQAVRQKLSETDTDDQAPGSVKRDLSGDTPSAVEAKRPATGQAAASSQHPMTPAVSNMQLRDALSRGLCTLPQPMELEPTPPAPPAPPAQPSPPTHSNHPEQSSSRDAAAASSAQSGRRAALGGEPQVWRR